MFRWHPGKEPTRQCRRHKKHGFRPWVRKISLSRKRATHSRMPPRKFHRQRSLAGYSPWGSQRVGHGWAHSTAHFCPDASKHVSALEKGSHYNFQAGVELISEVYGNGQRWYFIFGSQDNYKFLLKFSGQGTNILKCAIQSGMKKDCCCCSVAKPCMALCNPMDCGVPVTWTGFPVLHDLLEFVQTHVHWVGDAIQPSHPLLSPSLLSSIFPSILTPNIKSTSTECCPQPGWNLGEPPTDLFHEDCCKV